MKKLFGCLMFLGAVLLYGTAGASDHELIDWTQAVLQVSISFLMIGGGFIGIRVIDKITQEKEKRPRLTNSGSASSQHRMSTTTVNKLYQ